MMKSLKAGFTLAEVLTTLMVIGVVAAMTIPTLMNSTGEAQYKAATKKAASVLSQGVQLLEAREEVCTAAANANASSEALAACMSKVITGTRNGQDISTSDGMVYRFYVPEGKTFSSVLSTCNSTFDGFDGEGNCAVVVDLNGHVKGTTAFDSDDMPEGGFAASQEKDDVVAFSLSAAGVRPMAIRGGANKAHYYMFGSNPSNYDNVWCCPTGDVNAVCATGGADDGKYIQAKCNASASENRCADLANTTEIDSSNIVATCANP